jgi:hypothetical protein
MNRSPSRRLPRALAAVALAGTLALATAACGENEGSGDIVTVGVKDFEEDITALRVEDDIDVHVIVDPLAPQSATLRIDDNLLDDGYGDVDDDGELTVGFDSLLEVEPSETPLLTLRVKQLERVDNRDDGEIRVVGVDADDVEVENHADGSVVTA